MGGAPRSSRWPSSGSGRTCSWRTRATTAWSCGSCGDLARIERDGERIACGGGATLAAIVKRATGWGLSGIEFGCAIPGTAGGAVRMNAGAYGGELRDVLEQAVVVGGPEASGAAVRRSSA